MITLKHRLSSWLHKISVIVNTPRPAPVHMSAHCTNISMLLMHLCDFDRAQYSYALKWLAYPLRNPGAKMRYSLAITGPAGTGKSLFFHHVIGALYADQGRVARPEVLMSFFNDSWAGASMVVVDGEVPKHAAAHLKSLITSEFVLVQAKGVRPHMITNNTNFVFMSGQSEFMRTQGDRRFMAIEAPPARDRIFYQAVIEEIRNGGVGTFRDYLMHRLDLGGFNETTMPPASTRPTPFDITAELGKMETAPASGQIA